MSGRRLQPRPARVRSRGFTLVEAMVAIAVGAIAVVMSANIAALVIRNNTQSEQRSDVHTRTRIVFEQLRADIRSAGMGSTGAIGVDVSDALFASMAIVTDGGRAAIPAIAVANNVSDGSFRLSTDAIQLVVPNAAIIVRTVDRAQDGTRQLPVDGQLDATCELAYIHDHTSPTGAGRVQVAWIQAASPTQVTLENNLVFTVAPGSQVMCARISTYWLDEDGWLRRTDLRAGASAARVAVSEVWLSAADQNDRLAPGVEAFQVAVALSAEGFRQLDPPVPQPTHPAGRWAFTGRDPNANAVLLGADRQVWFEIRQVRVNVYARRMRAAVPERQPFNAEPREDGLEFTIMFGSGGEWVTASEAAVNLRVFDSATSAEMRAEPY